MISDYLTIQWSTVEQSWLVLWFKDISLFTNDLGIFENSGANSQQESLLDSKMQLILEKDQQPQETTLWLTWWKTLVPSLKEPILKIHSISISKFARLRLMQEKWLLLLPQWQMEVSTLSQRRRSLMSKPSIILLVWWNLVECMITQENGAIRSVSQLNLELEVVFSSLFQKLWGLLFSLQDSMKEETQLEVLRHLNFWSKSIQFTSLILSKELWRHSVKRKIS